MNKTILSCSVAALLTLSAGAAMAGTLDPGLYTITFTNPGAGSQTEPVSISGTGSSRDIVMAATGGSQTIHLTVSGTNLSGSANIKGVAVTLTGAASGTGASGSVHATHNGHAGNGSFSLAKSNGLAPRMMKSSNSSILGEAWDDLCSWLESWVDVGATSGPTAPGTGSGSTPGHLAPYVPPR